MENWFKKYFVEKSVFVFVNKRITIKHCFIFQELNVLFKPTNHISGMI